MGSECDLAFAKDLPSSTKSSFPQGLEVPGKVHAQHHQGWHQMRRTVKTNPALPLVTFPTWHCSSRDEPLHRHWAKAVGGSGALQGRWVQLNSSCTLFLVLLLQSEPGITCTRLDASLSSVALSHPCTTPMGRRWVIPIFPFCILCPMVSQARGKHWAVLPVFMVLSWTSFSWGGP